MEIPKHISQSSICEILRAQWRLRKGWISSETRRACGIHLVTCHTVRLFDHFYIKECCAIVWETLEAELRYEVSLQTAHLLCDCCLDPLASVRPSIPYTGVAGLGEEQMG